jgi:hypothetical protein
METPLSLTLGQAAIQAKVSKAYLSKLIKSGKISAARQPNGQFRIDPSELERISDIRSQTQRGNSGGERTDTAREQVLEAQLEAMRELLAEREREVQDLRTDRDAWRTQAERTAQTLLLTAGETRARPPKKRWWQR